MPSKITVIGMHDSQSLVEDKSNLLAITSANLIVAGQRHLDLLPLVQARKLAIKANLDVVMDEIAAELGSVCVLASGDPGFFGIVRPLSMRFGPALLDVRPTASSISLAFGRLGLAWDDATVISAHGRSLTQTVGIALRAKKIAILVSPDNPPQVVAKALLETGVDNCRAVVCSYMGTESESVVETDLFKVADGTWDPISVLIILRQAEISNRPSMAWGLPDSNFEHRAGMITKAEVRSVVLGKLNLPWDGVMWDVGAGCASVSIEAAKISPGMKVYAIERNPSDAVRSQTNIEHFGVKVEVVQGEAPEAFEDLDDPDRVFIGGGGIDVLDRVLERLRPNGYVVATYAALDRALQAFKRLGELVQVSVARGQELPDAGLRLNAQNPVFVVSGPNQTTISNQTLDPMKAPQA